MQPGKKEVRGSQALSAFFQGETDKLTTEQLAMYARIDLADNFIRKYGPAKALRYLRKHYEAKGESISVRTIQHDIANAQDLLASQSVRKKEYWRMVALEELRKAMRYALKIEKPEKKVEKIVEILKEQRLTMGYDQQDYEIPDFTGIGEVPVEITTNPEDIGIELIEDVDQIIERYRRPQMNTRGIPEAEIIGDGE
jgi:hypothetical protein